MDTTLQLDVTNVYPNIYKVEIELMSFQDLASTFTDEVLQGCSFSNIECALVDYITSIVDPVGWRAVWRSSKDSSILDLEYDFIVEVIYYFTLIMLIKRCNVDSDGHVTFVNSCNSILNV